MILFSNVFIRSWKKWRRHHQNITTTTFLAWLCTNNSCEVKALVLFEILTTEWMTLNDHVLGTLAENFPALILRRIPHRSIYIRFL
jgi:hypothetical protein